VHESTTGRGGSRPGRPAGPVDRQLDALMAWREAAERRGGRRSPERSLLGRELDLASRPLHADAVVAHPHPRLRAEIARHLTGHGVEVVGLGAGLTELVPPGMSLTVDLVLLHADRGTPPAPVLATVRAACPGAVVGVQTEVAEAGAALLEAGARAVFASRVAAADVAAALVSCLRGERDAVLLL
jgi:hypothetical protein